ncbi:MAG: D-glycero-beta-D-manno-heptose 1,7-bisphosphate 7-phosphatase [Gemmataceae bacterium]
MNAILLDRDGVINFDSDAFIKSPEEWRPIPGSVEAIARLHRAGWKVLVATNQSGLARGLLDDKTLAAIHAKMHRAVQDAGGWIDDIAFCPHGPEDGCDCRKPRAGLLFHLAHKWRLNLNALPCVGDSLRDLQAAHAAGCRPILVRTGNGRKTEREALPPQTRVYADLAAVAQALTPAGATGRAA